MLGRPLLLTGMLGAAVAAPIAMTEGPKQLDSLNLGKLGWSAGASDTPTVSSGSFQAPEMHSPEGPGALIYRSSAPIDGAGFVSLADLLRMDITKEWVYARWARKTTGLADPGLFGVRVPVVTGTSMTDLAGSISYYFNPDGQVDKLRFHGRTADTTAIMAIAQSHFGMQPQRPVAGEQLMRTFASGKVLCELRTRPEPVLWSTSPHDSFLVDLEVNRPGSGRFVEQRPLTPNLPQHPEPAAPAQPPQTAATPPQPSAETVADVEAADSEVKPALLQKAKRPDFRWPN